MAKPIVVGVDVRDLRIATTGTRTYLEELCRAFRAMNDPLFHFVFLDTGKAVYTGKNRLRKLAAQVSFQYWKQIVLPWKAWKNHCDVLFCTDYFVPLLRFRFKTVPVFHDAFFFEYAEHYNKIWLYLFHCLAVPAAKRSPVIITPSNYAKQQVSLHTGIATEKIQCVYEAPKSFGILPEGTTKPPIVSGILTGRRQGLQYILHVGSFDKRKNLPLLITAFHKLLQGGYTQFRLILAGKANGKQHTDAFAQVMAAIDQYGLSDFVIRTGYLEDEVLPDLYSNAFMYVFPSNNEGFGLPVLESFSFGLPVIAAGNTALPEIGGDAVLYFDPASSDDLCGKMTAIIENEQLRHELARKGKERLQLFSWKKAAAELAAIFKQVAAR